MGNLEGPREEIEYEFLQNIVSLVQEFHIPKLLKGALSGLRQFLTTDSPLKIMKNVFYFTSKAHFVLKNFCLDFLVMQQNDLIRKIILISTFMTSKPG